MVIKSAFGGGPIAVDFMWSSGTGSEDDFASPPSPMITLFLLASLFFTTRARLKSVGDPTFFLFQKNGIENTHTRNISFATER